MPTPELNQDKTESLKSWCLNYELPNVSIHILCIVPIFKNQHFEAAQETSLQPELKFWVLPGPTTNLCCRESLMKSNNKMQQNHYFSTNSKEQNYS